jgi:hypothetical protein
MLYSFKVHPYNFKVHLYYVKVHPYNLKVHLYYVKVRQFQPFRLRKPVRVKQKTERLCKERI